MIQNSVRHLRRGRLSCDVIALTQKQTEDVASEEVKVSISQHNLKKRGGQFCVAGGPYGTILLIAMEYPCILFQPTKLLTFRGLILCVCTG